MKNNKKKIITIAAILVFVTLVSLIVFFVYNFQEEQKTIANANAVENLIKKIDFNSADAEAKIAEAENAYNKLSAKEKNLVKSLSILTNYRSMLFNIHDVDMEISGLKYLTYNSFLADADAYEADVLAVECTYNKLSEAEKSKIVNYDILKDALERVKKMYCYLEECNNKAGNGYKETYCDDHRCDKLCGQLVVEGKKYCSIHACYALNCDNTTINEYDMFCISHSCKAVCFSYAANGFYCANHGCQVADCLYQKRSVSDRFCSSHTCGEAFCNNPKPKLDSYCSEHE